MSQAAEPNQPPASAERLRAEAIDFLKQGKLADAATRLRAALALASESPELHNLLGTALASQGDQDQAQIYFTRALHLKPDFADAMVNLGHSLRRIGKISEAIHHYQEALKLKPTWAEVSNNLGLALRSLGRLAEAEAQFRQAIRRQPHHTDSRNSLGVVLADQGRLAEAAAAYQQVLRQQPNASGTHNNLGVILLMEGKIREAIERFETALRLKPNYADAQNNLGNALMQDGKLEESEKSLRRALEVKPDLSEASNNLGRLLIRQGKIEEAVGHFQQALRVQPGYADARRNLAWCWLLTGNYSQGWVEQEWQWRDDAPRSRRFQQPCWRGEKCPGTILLYAEQKLEDTLHFIRYAEKVREAAGSVVVECQPALVPLLKGCPGVDEVVPYGSALPSFNQQASLLSLPSVFHTTLDTIPGRGAYLRADAERVDRWGSELNNAGRFRVGIAWQANPRDADDRLRAFPWQFFGRLAQIEGIRLVSLQKGPPGELWKNLTEKWKLIDLGARIHSDPAEGLLDVAAIMKNLDVVISPDTELAHLAGGLGVPVWVILPKAPPPFLSLIL